MLTILNIIVQDNPNITSFKTNKFTYEGIEAPRLDYEEHSEKFSWKKNGESIKLNDYKSLCSLAQKISTQPPLFSYFLDGSRKAYKVDDFSIKNQVFPIIAGQIGVGCCERINKKIVPAKFKEQVLCRRKFVISLPNKVKGDWDKDELYSNKICEKINLELAKFSNQLSFDKILFYSPSMNSEDDNFENKGIATIQDYMIENEKELVQELATKQLLSPNSMLIKDGSLEYPVLAIENNTKELVKFRNNYNFVVGVSKSFNPLNCVGKDNSNISNFVAKLPLYSRTPVQRYSSPRIGNMDFAIWYVRIRDAQYTKNVFDGILKIEKILVTDEQMEIGLDTEEVDYITAQLINERNPVCYGDDKRWANHLYPVYLTERYIKSKYLSDNLFMNIF